MNNPFRQNKYLNESGSKIGSWYMNRFVYFRFHAYPKYKQHKLAAFLISIISIVLLAKTIGISLLITMSFGYCTFVALLTFNIFQTRVCCYRGYFLYPTTLVKFFKDREEIIDVNDFDSVATMNSKHNSR